MRVTTLQTNDTMLNYISSSESKYYDLSKEASSGVKVSKESDDPAAAKSILNIKTQLNQLNSYLDNISTANNELDTLDSTLSSLTDAMQKASDLATQAANGTYNASDLKTIKTQVDQIIQSITDLANTQFDGKYIFSGAATATQTYTTTTDAAGNVTAITYNGTPSTGNYQRYVTISDGASVAINTAGSNIFGQYDSAVPANSYGLLGTLGTLSTALGANDKATTRTCIDNLTTEANSISAIRTNFASVSNRFTMTQDSINSTVTTLKAYKSDLQDADLTTVLADLTAQQTSLQATLQVSSKLLGGKSLLDYM